MTAAEKGSHVSDVPGEDDELDEEPGEVIESAPPLKVGEERELANCPGFRKKLLKLGNGWDSPEFNDEVTVHYVGTLLDGSKFESTRDNGGPVNFKLGDGEVVAGLDHAIITTKKGECALFTLPPELGYGASGCEGVPQNSAVQFEVELISTFIEVQKLLSKTNGKVVGDLMTPAPLVVRETTNLEDAARLLLEIKYRRLPVVDTDSKLVGIITQGNVVRAALHIKRMIENKE